MSTGRLRVDAARAISKLRTYQLPDRTAWILEGVRAAVAADATSIHLNGDANDVWLRWEGEPWPPEVLCRLLDELVSPEPARTGQRLRLLATAVNSALGMDPAYVDLYAVGTDGRSVRVRYKPDVLTVPENDGEPPPLELLTAEEASPPVEVDAPGMLVHLRRRAGLATLGNLLRGQPPEIRLALRACSAVPVPMRIGETEVGAGAPHSDLLRVELGRDLDGFIALTDPARRFTSFNTALMEVAERGVIVASYPIPLLPEVCAPVPLRVFINADRMPTNASRSDVRRDAFPIREAELLAYEKLPLLCDELVAALDPHSDDSDSASRDALRVGALALVASVAAGPSWERKVQQLPTALGELGRLPLLQNALGEARAVDSWWDGELVHVAHEPYPKEYAPWFGEALWLRPDDKGAQMLVGEDVDGSIIRRRAREARKQMRAQRRFHKHERRAPELDPPRHWWVRASLSASIEGSCSRPEELQGELYLLRWGHGGNLILLVEEREIEEVAVDADLPLRAIVADPHLQPHPDYRRVIKDNRFFLTEKSVRAAAVRAGEALALALAGQPLPTGFELSRPLEGDRVEATRMIRRAFRQAADLRLPVAKSEPFMSAQVWTAMDGSSFSLRQMSELPAIGTTQPGARFPVPASRPVFEADENERQLFRHLLEPGTAVVHYDPLRFTRDEDASHIMASTLTSQRGSVAVAIHADGMRGAIAWGVDQSTLHVYHMGVCLADKDTRAMLGPCAIAVDADAVVPSADWSDARDLAGIPDLDFSSWEVALARAVGHKLIGAEVPQLYASTELTATSRPVRSFFAAMTAATDPESILGAELIAALREMPLFPVHTALGKKLVSAAELAQHFDEAIPFVPAAPLQRILGDWMVIVADETVARGASWLADRPVIDGNEELERRLAETERDENLRQHRNKQRSPLELPGSAASVEIEADGLRGLVAPGARQGVDLQLLVEERSFHHLTLAGGIPLRAIVDLDPSLADDRFRFIPDESIQLVKKAVEAASERLILELVRVAPHALTASDTERALLLAYLRLHPSARDPRPGLREVKMFATVQGDYVSVSEVGKIVGTARWTSEWLAPLDGEQPDALDGHVLALDEGQRGEQVAQVIRLLGVVSTADVTEDVRRLQVRRRIERGLVPMPRVAGVPAEYKRSLAELDDLDDTLGSGEVGLIDGRSSMLTVYRDGERRGEAELDVTPRISVAIESSELSDELALGTGLSWDARERISALLRPAAWRLAEDVVSKTDAAQLPEWLRRSLVLAQLAGDVDNRLYELIAPLELFDTTTGERVSWRAIEAQAELFGEVWFVRNNWPQGSAPHQQPLDDRRFALALSDDETPTVFHLGLALKEASKELTLDALARKNRDRPPAASLALGPSEQHHAMSVSELKGDGRSAARGVVAPLRNTAGNLRGVYCHRNMQFLGFVDDPCSWPTVAIVDDARLQPDRTWSAPTKDAVFRRLSAAVRSHSENALTDLIPAPEAALTSHWVGRLAAKSIDEHEEVVLRGRLWLEGPPESGAIVVQYGGGDAFFSPQSKAFGPRSPQPVNGLIMVYPPRSATPTEPIQQVVDALYPRLLRQLVRRAQFVDSDIYAAHLAYGLALGAIEADEIGELSFDCFAPRPLDAHGLAKLLRSDDRVALAGDDDEAPTAGTVLLDDGSCLARTVIALLLDRTGRRPADEREPPAELPSFAAPAVAPKPTGPTQPAPHPLASLAEACRSRLTDIGIAIDVRIRNSSRPLAGYREGVIELAGQHPHLRHLHARCEDGDPNARAALDQLVAHVVSVLNNEPTHVTDAAEARALLSLLRA